MKLVQDTTQALGQAASQLTTSIDTAVTAVAGLATDLPAFIGQRISASQEGLQSVGTQLLKLPAALDPAPMVACLSAGASQSRELMTGFCAEIEKLPSCVDQFAAQAQPLIDQAAAVLKEHSSEIASARSTVSSLRALAPQEADVPAAVRLWWEQAGRALPVVETYAAKASAGQSLEELNELRQQTIGTLQALQSEVLQSCSSYRDALQVQVASSVQGLQPSGPAGASQSVQPQSDWSSSTGAASTLGTAGVGELQAAMERLRQLVPDISAKALQPLSKARGELDGLSARLALAGSVVLASVETALAPLQEIPPKLSQAVVSLGDVLSVFKGILGQIRKLIEDLVARAQQVVSQLEGIPALFNTVRSSIDAAVAQIADVAARIPVFIAQSIGALNMAAGELAQALSLCDYAIQICTRYMTKAPLLIPARALFMGIKATIPAVQASITTAKGSVQTVGTTAQAGLDQATLAVKALFPMLDTALAQVKSAAATLAAGINTLKGSLDQGVARMEGMGATVEGQIRLAVQKVDASSASFAKLPVQYAQQVPLDARLKAADQQLRQLSSAACVPVETAVAQMRPRLESLLKDAEQALVPKLAAAGLGLQKSIAQTQAHATRFRTEVSEVGAQVDASGLDLRELHRVALETVDRERGRLAELFGIVTQRLEAVHLEVLSMHDPAGSASGSAHG